MLEELKKINMKTFDKKSYEYLNTITVYYNKL